MIFAQWRNAFVLHRQKMHWWNFVDYFGSPQESQQAGTHARSLISLFTDKVNHATNHYRAARQALLALDAGGEWSQRLLELKAEHVKGP
jgi:hypothetical protein